jgi:pyridoxal phosphate enzyme (YggS family)
MIHSVDSLDLLREIDRQAAKYNRVVPCLLQIHVAQEETKFGFSPEECTQMLLEGTWRNLGHVRLCGIMGMATNTDDIEQVRREFRFLKNYFNELKTAFFQDDAMFSCRSWGMSDDYRIALSEGSNMVRVGSRIFGPRP